MKGGRKEYIHKQKWLQSEYDYEEALELERMAREEAERAAREEALERERQRLHQVWLDHEERVRQSAVNATRAFNEYRANQNRSCSILGGRIKNTFRKKNKSNKNKSKRVNKRHSRKSSRKSLKK